MRIFLKFHHLSENFINAEDNLSKDFKNRLKSKRSISATQFCDSEVEIKKCFEKKCLDFLKKNAMENGVLNTFFSRVSGKMLALSMALEHTFCLE